MTSFSMDGTGALRLDPATEKDLSDWANVYQEKFFKGWPEPFVTIRIIDDTGGIACFDTNSKAAFVERPICASHKFAKIALLHEMVHINLFTKYGDPDKDHGFRFKSEINRMIQEGAYENLL